MSPRQPDGTIYLTVGGDWTQPAAGALRSLFDRVRRHRPTLVIADLSDVTVMDSTALDALIEAHRGLAATGCRFELHNVPPHLGRQLQNTGLGRALPVTDATPTRRARPTAPAPTGRRAAPQPDLTPTAAGHIASGKGPHHAPAD
jgi:anti-sigma B factor antagonist